MLLWGLVGAQSYRLQPPRGQRKKKGVLVIAWVAARTAAAVAIVLSQRLSRTDPIPVRSRFRNRFFRATGRAC